MLFRRQVAKNIVRGPKAGINQLADRNPLLAPEKARDGAEK
ncbi:hypothetical protein J2W96_007491 [Variovorax guangxiensis]|nr:hypothetical protein [Variovorax guangxiensis]